LYTSRLIFGLAMLHAISLRYSIGCVLKRERENKDVVLIMTTDVAL
jgi:hypothetical protein